MKEDITALTSGLQRVRAHVSFPLIAQVFNRFFQHAFAWWELG
jgi:hypothetical protein